MSVVKQEKKVDVPTDDDPSIEQFTDETGAPATLPEIGAGGEESKLRVLLGLLKKLVGVKDVANLRLSLPASLLEPIPNLEYWQYCDRADIFAAIGDSPDELERMLSVLRFSFSKELKFVRARLGKPYNSALGEHFRCSWRLPPILIDSATKEPVIRTHIHVPIPGEPAYGGQGGSGWTTPVLRPEDGGIARSETSSIKSNSSKTSRSKLAPSSPITKSASKSKSSLEPFDMSSLKNAIPGPGDEIESQDPDAGVVDSEKVSVVFLCEQVSHHPPISAAYYGCPEKGIEAVGMDQIVAKVSGMSVKVGPGPSNRGIFVRITRDGPGKGEEYQITHPSAQVNGILKGAYYGTVSDQISITCRGGDSPGGGSPNPSTASASASPNPSGTTKKDPKTKDSKESKEKDKGKATTKLRAILDYKEESWLGRPRFLVDGIIYRYTPGDKDSEEWTRAKQVPVDRVVGYLEGNWMKQIKWKLKGEKEWRTLIDLDLLALIPKSVRPLSQQDQSESRKMWDPVTQNLIAKNWGEATKQKQVIEQKQRDLAAKRKQAGEVFTPRYFESTWEDGRPKLTEEGKKAVEEEIKRGEKGVDVYLTPTPSTTSFMTAEGDSQS